MNNLKKQFIEFTLNHEILRFGTFTLNSGRQSPYFFNTGLCNNGKLLSSLAKFYSNFIVEKAIEYDFIFGPAYKGITLASSISQTLYLENSVNKPFCYNRKEVKTHGESGLFVGHQPTGTAIIIDDVISSGRSIAESIDLLTTNHAKPASVIVAFDRMEVGKDKRASIELSEHFNVSVHSIITLDDIVSYIQNDESLTKYLSKMEEYMSEYKR